VGTARPLGPQLWTGAGELRPATALAARALIEPSSLALPRQAAGAKFVLSRPLTVSNPGSTKVTVRLSARLAGLRATITPASLTLAAGERTRVTLEVAAETAIRAGYVNGRVSATGAGTAVSALVGLPIGPPPPARLGSLSLASSRGRTDGVRFTAGAVTVSGGGRSVEPLGNLRLQLVSASGRVVRELTPAGGAPDLLPGEYAYTLTGATRKGLAKGGYRFVARALGPAGGPAIVRKSPTFAVR
jgi:hypothetical protein